MQSFQDEPYGGLPTLAYGKLFQEARARGVVVTLDGQGMDEQWAGYEYFAKAVSFETATGSATDRFYDSVGIVQAVKGSASRPECLLPEFRALAVPLAPERPFPDALRNLQLRDAHATKLPRALRFNDRASMRASSALREPVLDHRLFELAVRQPAERKIGPDGGKRLLREIARSFIPPGVAQAPKRPLQTPQREWLRGPLAEWAEEQVEAALDRVGGVWLDPDAVRGALREYRARGGDNSFFLWQWIGLGLTPIVSEISREALHA
jgi:asparagine synthase (glutamine-hydrolysing)